MPYVSSRGFRRGRQRPRLGGSLADFAGVAASVVEAVEPRVLLSSYFVSTAGSDNNPGSLDQPFGSIQKAASVAQAGDTVFVRGGTYRETVTPANSGTPAAPIVFQPYNNEPVTVSGADPVAGWGLHGGSVYKAAQGWDLGFGRNQVFVDGKMMIEARWPNTSLDVSRPAKAAAGSVSAAAAPEGSTTTAVLFDTKLTHEADYWTGATIHIAPGQGWSGQTGTVTNYTPGQLTYAYQQLNTRYETPTAGNKYYLTGKFRALDAAGEWFRESDGSLYLWTPAGDNPTSHTVEAKRRQFAFDLRGRSDVQVVGFKIFAASVTSDAASSRIKISRINAQYVAHFTLNPNGAAAPPDEGIHLGGTGSVLEDSTVAYSAAHGVFLSGSGSTVRNTFVRDTNYTGSGSAAVSTRGSGGGHTIERNTVFNSGRSAIVLSFSSGNRVLFNEVRDVMLQTTDGGGIYAFGTDGGGSEIAYNRVFRITSGGFGAAGIFMDNGSSNFLIHHNVVWGCNAALKMNPASRGHRVYNNTLVGGSYSVASSGTRDMVGTVFANNIFQKTTQIGSSATQQNNLPPTVNPLFVAPTASTPNFQLQSGSPAIDAGTTVPPYTDGFVGAAPDQGAYEFGKPAWTAGATPVTTPPPPDPTTRDARGRIEAESFNAQVGVTVNSTKTAIGFLDNNDWVKFSAVDFGSGLTTFKAHLAVPAANAGKMIEVRTGSPAGPLAGTLITASTGGWSTYATQSAPVSALGGVKDLYLVFKGGAGVGNLDWVTFAADTPTPPQRNAREVQQAETFDAMQGVLKRDYGVGSTSSGDWVKYAGVDFGSGVSTFQANIAVPASNAGRRVEIRTGSPTGALAGVLTTTSTGAWNVFTPQSTSVTGLSGVKDLYLVFQGGEGVANVDWFVFS